jgi:hypothetical protein
LTEGPSRGVCHAAAALSLKAKKAKVTLPPLEEYERLQVASRVVQLRPKKQAVMTDEAYSEKHVATA